VNSKYPARIRALIFSAVALSAVAAQAQEQQKSPAERQVEYRQAVFDVLASNSGPLNQMAQGRMPFDAAVAAKKSERVAQIARFLDDAFPATSQGVADSKAKPEIWTKSDDFKKDFDSLVSKADALAAAGKTGDQAKIKAATTDLQGACKACHDDFRAK
jgi:cytochrome c556